MINMLNIFQPSEMIQQKTKAICMSDVIPVSDLFLVLENKGQEDRTKTKAGNYWQYQIKEEVI